MKKIANLRVKGYENGWIQIEDAVFNSQGKCIIKKDVKSLELSYYYAAFNSREYNIFVIFNNGKIVQYKDEEEIIHDDILSVKVLDNAYLWIRKKDSSILYSNIMVEIAQNVDDVACFSRGYFAYLVNNRWYVRDANGIVFESSLRPLVCTRQNSHTYFAVETETDMWSLYRETFKKPEVEKANKVITLSPLNIRLTPDSTELKQELLTFERDGYKSPIFTMFNELNLKSEF